MSLYDINFNTQVKLLLPPSKRKPKMLAWLYALVFPIQYLRDLFFDVYSVGTAYANWDVLVTYNSGDRVTWTDSGIYECILSGALAIEPTGNASSLTYWIKVQDNFIGLDERILFSSQIITFEYALNRWFQNLASATRIYIGNNDVIGNSMIMSDEDDLSSYMTTPESFQEYYMFDDYDPITYDFTIYVPSALWATLGTNDGNRESRVRNFANKYIAAGITYNVTTF